MNSARSRYPRSSITWAGLTSSAAGRRRSCGLSNGDLRSKVPYPWDDVAVFGRMYYEAAPDRCLWGTDWPHVHRFLRPDKDGHSEYGVAHELRGLTLLERYVPDRQARDRVLVDNPAGFFGFD